MGSRETLVGRSPAIRATRRKIACLARLHTPLVITGEGGTGKSLLARIIHQARAGAGGYFEANIAAISQEYLGLEMFGLERGTISWAKKSWPGLLELARGGTACLRNFELWPRYLELALLRLLREGVIVRMGGGPPIPVRLRIIGTTSDDPTRRVTQKSRVTRPSCFGTVQTNVQPLDRRSADRCACDESARHRG